MGIPVTAKVGLGVAAIAGVAYLAFTYGGGSSPATGSVAAAAAGGGPTGSGPTSKAGVYAEDAALGVTAGLDKVLEWGGEAVTFGAWDPHPGLAASTYSAINGLSAQQSAAVQQSEDSGAVNQAAQNTVDQLSSWGTGLLVVAGVAGALYVAVLVAPALKAVS